MPDLLFYLGGIVAAIMAVGLLAVVVVNAINARSVSEDD